MSNSNKDIMAILDRYCLSAIKSNDDKTFFLSIADYVKFADANSESNSAINKILKEKNEEYKIQEEYETKAIEEITKVLDILKSLAIKHDKIKERVNGIFLENEKYERSEISSTQSKVDRLFGYATEIIRLLRDNGKNTLVSQYVQVDPKNADIIISYSISESYDRYTEEKDLMKYRNNFILGGEWNNLVWVFSTLNNIRELLKTIRETEKKEVFLWFAYYDRYKEMIGIMEGKKDGLGSFFKRENHQRSLIRINNYLLQELLLETRKRLPKKDNLDTTIPAEGEPITNIKVSKGERKFYVLVNDKKQFEFTIRNADEKNKTRYWDLIISIAENGNAEPDPKTTNGVLSYFNSSKANPILKVFNAQQLLEISSECLYPHAGVKFEIMKDAIRKKYFKG